MLVDKIMRTFNVQKENFTSSAVGWTHDNNQNNVENLQVKNQTTAEMIEDNIRKNTEFSDDQVNISVKSRQKSPR